MIIDADWCWLMLIDTDWCWLMPIDADWCWLMLIDMLIDANWCSNKVQMGFLFSERTSGASLVIFYTWNYSPYIVSILTYLVPLHCLLILSPNRTISFSRGPSIHLLDLIITVVFTIIITITTTTIIFIIVILFIAEAKQHLVCTQQHILLWECKKREKIIKIFRMISSVIGNMPAMRKPVKILFVFHLPRKLFWRSAYQKTRLGLCCFETYDFFF